MVRITEHRHNKNCSGNTTKELAKRNHRMDFAKVTILLPASTESHPAREEHEVFEVKGDE